MAKRRVGSARTARQRAASRANLVRAREVYRGLAVKRSSLPKDLNGLSVLRSLRAYQPQPDVRRQGPGLGLHWTTKKSLAQEATHQSKGDTRVVLTGLYRGGGKRFKTGIRVAERELEIPNSRSPRVTSISVNGVSLGLKPIGKHARKNATPAQRAARASRRVR